MRFPLPLLALGLTLACGNKVDHPAAASECDPSTMECGGYKPPMSGQPGGGNEGGSDSNTPEGATVSGEVLSFADDFFVEGFVYSEEADVSAIGETGARVQAHYDGISFELMGVLKDATNWFMVVPEENSGMLTTITPVDTRVISADVAVGLASEITVDGLFALVGAERSQTRAQVVVRVVDDQGRSVAGVSGALTAEVVAYREAGGWITTDAGTDDSGMIFFGNVPATPALAKENIIFSGAVSARVEARIMAGATTIVTAVVSPP